ELLQTAKVASELVERGNDVAERSLNEVSRLIADISNLDEQLQAFLDTLGTIGGIARTLSQIAEQTELLSFNARIEAARGGERRRRSKCSPRKSAGLLPPLPNRPRRWRAILPGLSRRPAR